MNYYKLKNGVEGYSDNHHGIIYPETHKNIFGHTVKQFVKSFPDDWEEVNPSIMETFKFGK